MLYSNGEIWWTAEFVNFEAQERDLGWRIKSGELSAFDH